MLGLFKFKKRIKQVKTNYIWDEIKKENQNNKWFPNDKKYGKCESIKINCSKCGRNNIQAQVMIFNHKNLENRDFAISNIKEQMKDWVCFQCKEIINNDNRTDRKTN